MKSIMKRIIPCVLLSLVVSLPGVKAEEVLPEECEPVSETEEITEQLIPEEEQDIETNETNDEEYYYRTSTGGSYRSMGRKSRRPWLPGVRIRQRLG